MDCVDMDGRVVGLYQRKKRQVDGSCGGYICCDTSTFGCLTGRVSAGMDLMVDKPAGLGPRLRIQSSDYFSMLHPGFAHRPALKFTSSRQNTNAFAFPLSLIMTSLDPPLEPLPR